MFPPKPLLTNDAWRRVLAESLRQARAKYEIDLWVYVFMPEHVHLLLKPRPESYDLGVFEQSLKTSSAKRILNSLKRQNAPLLKHLLVR